MRKRHPENQKWILEQFPNAMNNQMVRGVCSICKFETKFYSTGQVDKIDKDLVLHPCVKPYTTSL